MIEFYVDWRCPACGLTDQTPPLPPNGSRMHLCPKMGGLTTPMVKAGTKAKIERVMREDYTNGDLVRKDDEGRVVMGLKITRDNGQDAVVYAPTATARS